MTAAWQQKWLQLSYRVCGEFGRGGWAGVQILREMGPDD